MSILNVNTIQPIGSGTTVTVAATELKTSNFITVGTGASVTSPSANVLTLGTNTAERFRITSAGSIGIGTDNPGTKLDVRGGNWSNGDIVVGQSGNAGRIKFRRGADGSDSAFIGFAAADNNSRLSIGVDSGDGTIAFQTNSAERLRIDSSGRLGLGVVPEAFHSNNKAVIRGDSGYAILGRGDNSLNISQNFYYDSSDAGKYIANGEASIYNQSDGQHVFYSAVSGSANASASMVERLRITSAGDVGIGENSPADRLVVQETNADGDVAVRIKNDTLSDGSASTPTTASLYLNTSTGNFNSFYIQARRYDNDTHFGYSNPRDGGHTPNMIITNDGQIQRPKQPLAIMGTTQNNWSPSAGDVLPFNYSNTNRGNHYNTSNYTFTCPVAGDYMVILRLSRKGWCGDLELAKNNSQYAKLELRETGRNSSSAADWQAWCYDFIVPCAANDTLKWKAPSVYTGTGGGNYLLDGFNHIYYDSVTYYLMG